MDFNSVHGSFLLRKESEVSRSGGLSHFPFGVFIYASLAEQARVLVAFGALHLLARLDHSFHDPDNVFGTRHGDGTIQIQFMKQA